MNERIAKNMSFFTSCVAESVMWNWDNDYKATHVKKALEKLQKSIKETVNILELSEIELAELGFMRWAVGREESDPIMLIPLYIFPIIPKGTEVFCIDGSKKVVGVDKIDDDTRVGCIAYGIKPKK